jgi:hypothetical protein
MSVLLHRDKCVLLSHGCATWWVGMFVLFCYWPVGIVRDRLTDIAQRSAAAQCRAYRGVLLLRIYDAALRVVWCVLFIHLFTYCSVNDALSPCSHTHDVCSSRGGEEKVFNWNRRSHLSETFVCFVSVYGNTCAFFELSKCCGTAVAVMLTSDNVRVKWTVISWEGLL